MTRRQYMDRLRRIGLKPASKYTVAATGLSIRQCIRVATGESPVPEPVARLLDMYVEHGLPERYRPPAKD